MQIFPIFFSGVSKEVINKGVGNFSAHPGKSLNPAKGVRQSVPFSAIVAIAETVSVSRIYFQDKENGVAEIG